LLLILFLCLLEVVEDPALYAARMQQPLTIKYIDPHLAGVVGVARTVTKRMRIGV